MKTNTKVADYEFAARLFAPKGTDCIGPRQLAECKALNLDLDPDCIPEIPQIQRVELERALELGQFLIYRHDKMKTGPLTIRTVHDGCNNIVGEGNLLRNIGWCNGGKEIFFEEEKITPGWYLVGREEIPGSTGMDYLGQTLVIADYLAKVIYQDQKIPKIYAEAIRELDDQEDILRELVMDDWKRGAIKLSELKLNQFCRQSGVEFIYDNTAYLEVNGRHLFPNKLAWLRSLSSDGDIVDVGYCGPGGVSVGSGGPRSSRSLLGVRFSRRLVPNMES